VEAAQSDGLTSIYFSDRAKFSNKGYGVRHASINIDKKLQSKQPNVKKIK
jgi:hypothetical protein